MALNDWADGEQGGTPLSAERLNERDQAITALQDALDEKQDIGSYVTTSEMVTALDGKQDAGNYVTASDFQDALDRIAALESASGGGGE